MADDEINDEEIQKPEGRESLNVEGSHGDGQAHKVSSSRASHEFEGRFRIDSYVEMHNGTAGFVVRGRR